MNFLGWLGIVIAAFLSLFTGHAIIQLPQGDQWVSLATISNEIPGYDGYALTNGTVYFGAVAMNPQPDPATFQVALNGLFARDRNAVYYDGTPVVGANPKSFVFLNPAGNSYFFESYGRVEIYSEDTEHVYINGGVIPAADPSSFQILGSPPGASAYSKDKNNVYFIDQVIPGADPQSFQLDQGQTQSGALFDAQDKNHEYLDGQVVQ